jgi:hypothetical protein
MQTVFSHGLELFCFCLALHIFIWRLFPTRAGNAQLALIFLFGPGLLLGIIVLVSVLTSGSFPSIDWTSWALAGLLHFALAGVYLVLHTSMAGFSPSIGILERVERSMPHGLTRSELAPPWFNDKNLSGARRGNLVASGMIYESRGLLLLTPRGRFIAGCFLIFRRILGLPDVAEG